MVEARTGIAVPGLEDPVKPNPPAPVTPAACPTIPGSPVTWCSDACWVAGRHVVAAPVTPRGLRPAREAAHEFIADGDEWCHYSRRLTRDHHAASCDRLTALLERDRATRAPACEHRCSLTGCNELGTLVEGSGFLCPRHAALVPPATRAPGPPAIRFRDNQWLRGWLHRFALDYVKRGGNVTRELDSVLDGIENHIAPDGVPIVLPRAPGLDTATVPRDLLDDIIHEGCSGGWLKGSPLDARIRALATPPGQTKP